MSRWIISNIEGVLEKLVEYGNLVNLAMGQVTQISPLAIRRLEKSGSFLSFVKGICPSLLCHKLVEVSKGWP